MKKHPGIILIAPRITEKGALLAEQGAYVFTVAEGANKRAIAEAVREIYSVSPRKVTLMAIPRKQVMTRGTNRKGLTVGGKKAYVFLKKGEKIDFA
jgi:ribosomal protein L23